MLSTERPSARTLVFAGPTDEVWPANFSILLKNLDASFFYSPATADSTGIDLPRASHQTRLAPLHLTPHAGPTSCRAPRPCLAPRAVRASWTSLHSAEASRWAHVATVCFMRFRCMLHIFQLDVVKVDLYMYVASVCFKYFSYFKHMLQVFHLDVA
jgi:hypothetical protein